VRWQALAARVAWTPPSRAEVAAVARAALAASLAWMLAVAVTDVDAPILAPLAAIISVRVSVHASVRSAIERSAAVVAGVLVALALGSAIGLSALTVGLLTGGSLGVALLLLRLPRPAATQVPVSALAVMASIGAGEEAYALSRTLETVLGAAVGVAVSLALPASRVDEARETLRRLATSVGDELDMMSVGLAANWSTEQTAEWRRTARITRQRLVTETTEAVGQGREAAHWNVRDRSHIAELVRYEQVLPRLERTAIGVWAISRGLEDHAQLTGGEHVPMPDMAALLASLGGLVRVFASVVLGEHPAGGVLAAVEDVLLRRAPCAAVAHHQVAADVPAPDRPSSPAEWMSYTALLVQVDRIVEDLRQPLPT
jgi:uncharacterized membrane protein YgaE (UPF0421/DUF939 family)